MLRLRPESRYLEVAARLEGRPIVLCAVDELRLQRREDLAVRQWCWIRAQSADQTHEHVGRWNPDLETFQVTRLAHRTQMVVEAARPRIINCQPHQAAALKRLENRA